MTIKINGTNTAANPSITGTDTDTGIVYGSDQIDFSTGGSSKVTLNGSNFGIGTQTPDVDFHISGGSSVGKIESTTSSNSARLIIKSANNTYTGLHFGDDADDDVGRIRYYHNTDFMQFSVGATERMRIDSSGKVCIGTTSPQAVLHVEGGSEGNLIQLSNTNTGATNSDGFVFGINSSLTYLYNRENKAIAFGTNNTERMRIVNRGGVNVGSGVLSSDVLEGNIVVDEGIYIGSFVGESQIRANSAGTGTNTLFIGNQSIQTSSDRRIKQNIVDTKIDASSQLKKVRVVDFTWNDPNDKAINNRNSRGEWTGCIAQEIVDVFPFAVNAPRPEGKEIDYDSEFLWGMEYGQLVPVLIKGFQELQAKIETLETKVAALEAA